MSIKNGLFAVVAALTVLSAGAAQATDTLTGAVTADNYFFAYLSTSPTTLGTLIGSGSNWGAAYALTPTVLTPGMTYYLNIEGINGDSGAYSAGGLIGVFQLSGGATFSNGTQQLLTGASGWLGGYNDSNNRAIAQPWVAPTGAVASEGAEGVGPWGNIGGISSSADWIWPTGALSGDGAAAGDQCAACTVDFQTEIQDSIIPEPSSVVLLIGSLLGVGLIRPQRMTGWFVGRWGSKMRAHQR